ncbi:MAG TPA: hypothetical protein VHF58_00335 [Solirubrobacterales bacterium]|nr:hypothetical protein [Solirubrobacterales bacterium]
MSSTTYVRLGFRGCALVAVAATIVLAGCGDEGSDAEQPQAAAEEAAAPPQVSLDGVESVPLADRLVRKVPISDGPDWMTAAFGSLWVKRDNGAVDRVDPETGEVLAEISPGPFKPPVCQGIGATDDAVWACSTVGELIRIDPRTDAITATVRVDKIPDQGRLASAAGKLWVLTHSGKVLTALDGETGKPTDEVKLPSTCTDLAAAGDELWVVCPVEGLALRIDSAAAEVGDEVELPDARTAAVGEDLWVGFEGGVAQVDLETLETLATYEVYPRYGGSIYAAEDAVWVREEGDRFLTRIDPAEQQIVETIGAPKIPSGGDVVQIEGSVWATAYDDDVLVRIRGEGAGAQK